VTDQQLAMAMSEVATARQRQLSLVQKMDDGSAEMSKLIAMFERTLEAEEQGSRRPGGQAELGQKVEPKPIQAELTPPGLGLIEGVEAHIGPWTAPELARYLRQSRGSVYDAIKAGKLPAIKTATATIRICAKAAGQWLRERKTVPEPGTKPVRPKARSKKKPPL
jgi:hypothetical protein